MTEREEKMSQFIKGRELKDKLIKRIARELVEQCADENLCVFDLERVTELAICIAKVQTIDHSREEGNP